MKRSQVSQVLRGGGYSSTVKRVRSARRSNVKPDYVSLDVGFRLARTLRVKEKFKPPKIIFIGQNPSKHNLDHNVAFFGSKSYRTLNEWIRLLGITDYYLVNASEKLGKVTTKDVNYAGLVAIGYHPDAKVICLGNYAYKAYKKVSKNFLNNKVYKIDHPSPLNRKLNDPRYVKNMLEKCKIFIYED